MQTINHAVLECGSCKAGNPIDAKFCKACGTAIEIPNSVATDFGPVENDRLLDAIKVMVRDIASHMPSDAQMGFTDRSLSAAARTQNLQTVILKFFQWLLGEDAGGVAFLVNRSEKLSNARDAVLAAGSFMKTLPETEDVKHLTKIISQIKDAFNEVTRRSEQEQTSWADRMMKAEPKGIIEKMLGHDRTVGSIEQMERDSSEASMMAARQALKVAEACCAFVAGGMREPKTLEHVASSVVEARLWWRAIGRAHPDTKKEQSEFQATLMAQRLMELLIATATPNSRHHAVSPLSTQGL